MAATGARGDEEGKARSRELNAQATHAMDTGDLRLALKRYREAYDAYPSPKLHFNLGLVLDKLGQHAEAANELQAFLDEVPDAPADTQKFARDEIATLAPKLGHATVHCEAPAANVHIDEIVLPCDKPRYVEPGEHKLDVTAEGYDPTYRTLVVPRGALMLEAGLVKVRVEAPPVAVGSADTPSVASPLDSKSSAAGHARHPSYAGPIGLAIASGLILTAGAGLYGDAFHTHSEDHCGTSIASPSGCTSSKHIYVAGQALLGVGAAGLAIDIVLWAVDIKKRRAAR